MEITIEGFSETQNKPVALLSPHPGLSNDAKIIVNAIFFSILEKGMNMSVG